MPAKKKIPTKKTASEKNAPAAKKSALKKASVSRSRSAAGERKNAPIFFSLDDVEELLANKKPTKADKEESAERKTVKTKTTATKKVVEEVDAPAEKRVLGAASLADILGFNPGEKKPSASLKEVEVPKKWQKYYDLLLELRSHVSDEINLHTADTLQSDGGDGTGLGTSKDDEGTDTFDRDFALSVVANEQEALYEIEEAINRIKDGSYGFCEVTGKPIPAARLTAVPFARFSVEGQVQHEKNQARRQSRSVQSGGIFGDLTDAPKIQSSDDEDE